MSFPKLLFRLLLGRRLPITSGELAIPGVVAPIRIIRDRWGIPHISATSDADAWFGLGFCQGQDRAFQLEGILRICRGTLAELVGPFGIPVDRLSRRVGFHRAAVTQYDLLSPDARLIINSFAAGITAAGRHGLTRRPHELVLLGGSLTPWTGIDVLAFVKLQSFMLPSNWDAELARLQVLTLDGADALLALDPAARGEWTSPVPALDALKNDLVTFQRVWPTGGGSNNWVIGPERTASGRPILANDPHLFPSLPSQWYLAHLTTPDWSLAGATFSGSPGFASAFNGHVAWGVTAALVDNADLFLERISPDGQRVQQGDGWTACQVIEEVIQVKGRPSVMEKVVVTPRGPIISPALNGDWPALSLSATWLRPRPVRGFLFAHRARNIAELRACFDQWPCLPLNLAFADIHGDIGWQMVGEAPIRIAGTGSVPRPGWLPDSGWRDSSVPHTEMPHVINPEEHFYTTANNPPPATSTSPFLGIDWLDPFRRDRIHESIAERSDWSLAECQRLQQDRVSIPWRMMKDHILAAIAPDPELRQAHEVLVAWDGKVDPDSPAASLFELFSAEMIVRLTRVKAPRSSEWYLGTAPCTPGVNLMYLRRTALLVDLIRRQPDGWFPESWPTAIRTAMTLAQSRNEGKPWGDLHRLRPKSMLLGDRPFLRHIFCAGPIAFGGDADTINQGSVRPLAPIGETDNIAGLRMVVDVGNWSASRFVLAGGQSGNPLSPHYADMFEIWQRGEGVPLAWTEEEVRTAAHHTLTLTSSSLGIAVAPFTD